MVSDLPNPAGGDFWLIRLLGKKAGAPAKTVLGWGVLAEFFLYMSADDGAKIHERIGTSCGILVQAKGQHAVPSLANRLLERVKDENDGERPSWWIWQ